MKIVRRLLLGLHLFVGIGAMFGGMTAILNPQEPLGMPVEVLKNSPFSDYLIPGIILFAVIGIGNVFGAVMLLAKSKVQGYISCVFSGAIVIWIFVQCIMLDTVAFLHVLYFAIGLIMALLSVLILFEQKLFPTNILIGVYQKFKKK